MSASGIKYLALFLTAALSLALLQENDRSVDSLLCTSQAAASVLEPEASNDAWPPEIVDCGCAVRHTPYRIRTAETPCVHFRRYGAASNFHLADNTPGRASVPDGSGAMRKVKCDFLCIFRC